MTTNESLHDEDNAGRAAPATESNGPHHEVATLAGGCFWCTEAIFRDLRGVKSVMPGYTGGHGPDPTYQQVCAGTTGHAEAVQITFDPGTIPYTDLLRVFFTLHDPTTLNRQGADAGTQYRSAVFYHDAVQEQAAYQIIAEFNSSRVRSDPIVTEVTPASVFYPAEDYHRDYYSQHTAQPYCQAVITPKVAKLRQKFREKLRL
jgi:peptide-methionine (S)-S-oxide reductase